MLADLSTPGTRHAASSASQKCHTRTDCEDRSDPPEDATSGAGERLVSGSGSHRGNWAPNRGWAAGWLESSGDHSGRPKSKAHHRFGVRTSGANGDFVHRFRASEDSGRSHE